MAIHTLRSLLSLMIPSATSYLWAILNRDFSVSLDKTTENRRFQIVSLCL